MSNKAPLATVEIHGPAYTIGDRRVTKLVVLPLSFRQFVDAIEAANAARAAMRVPPKSNRKFVLREKRAMQVRAVLDGGGEPVAIALEDMSRMPRAYAMQIDAVLEASVEPDGKVIGKGDGAITPVLYAFGTPIKVGDVECPELEFMARTLGDIEDVLAESSRVAMTLALIRNCSKPIMTEKSLLVLPEWAIDQITLIDGLAIMEHVLPSFLG